MSKEKYYFSKSLEKGLKILSLFNRETPVLTQSEIAKTLGLNMTSTYRYINTLVELEYLAKDTKTKEIRPSILCLLFCNNLMRATDHLKMIKEVVLVYSLPDFSKNCLHNTSLGKAYLSSLPDDLIAEKIDTMVLVAKTEKTIVDKDALAVELKKTKARQYAMSTEEYLPGLIAIGAPLYDPLSGKGVGAVCFDFSVLQHSAKDIKTKYGDMIRETAKSLSGLLPPGKNRR